MGDHGRALAAVATFTASCLGSFGSGTVGREPEIAWYMSRSCLNPRRRITFTCVFPANGALIVLCILSLPWLDSLSYPRKRDEILSRSAARASHRDHDR